MRNKLFAILMALPLGACVSPTGAPNDAANAPSDPASAFAALIGTPFVIAFKIPICAATLPVVAVGMGMSAPAERGEEARRVLTDGLAQNCGPPYGILP